MCAIPNLQVNLDTLRGEDHRFTFRLDDNWFATVDRPMVERGEVSVEAVLHKAGSHCLLRIETAGTVELPCDRCLQPLTLSADTQGQMEIRTGDEPTEDEHLLVVDAAHPIVDLAWLAYEQVVLSLPIRHTHEDETCAFGNENGHDSSDDSNEGDAQKPIDPRWQQLRQLNTDHIE